MMHCPACYGRVTCGSCGPIKCVTCMGGGSLLTRKVAVMRWKTLSTRKVSATSRAATVLDDVFHRVQGIQLCNTQAYQCTPTFFADSFFLNKLSSEVTTERALVPHTARVIVRDISSLLSQSLM
ncbi:unnamed protein product [Coffea canephora]|uniref:Uncharacterized protein n=1 Tax=Coffea canephora TaxID=49390 RepID=A0A068TTJ9_COFCA|nr:unnamed protein product [Coffea canephora]